MSNVDTVLVSSEYLSVTSRRVAEGVSCDLISYIAKTEHTVGITEGGGESLPCDFLRYEQRITDNYKDITRSTFEDRLNTSKYEVQALSSWIAYMNILQVISCMIPSTLIYY